MVSSLFPDPISYTHAESYRNIPYGRTLHAKLNWYRHSARLSGGNPWIAYAHGGGATTSNKTASLEGLTNERLTWAYLLDPSYPTAALPFDIFSIEYERHSIDSQTASAYERVAKAASGPRSFPGYFPRAIDDYQHAVQTIKDRAGAFSDGKFDIDPSLGVAWGNSIGGTIALDAVFGPQRQYTTHPRDRWQRSSPSTLLGVINYYGVINLSPWFTDFTLVGGDLGLACSDLNKSRSDREKVMLEPDSSGAYPSTVSSSRFCKSISPTDVIVAANADRRTSKILSVYRTFETTTVPVATYAPDIPPYTAHEYLQGGMGTGMLGRVCADQGVSHQELLVTGSSQVDAEAVLPGVYAWLVDLVG